MGKRKRPLTEAEIREANKELDLFKVLIPAIDHYHIIKRFIPTY